MVLLNVLFISKNWKVPGKEPGKVPGKIMDSHGLIWKIMESTWEKVGVGKPWKTMKVEQTHWD
jgi:hypothetical protein